jgi:glycosyltransferase involved in cell wall biosynthesis
MVHANPSTFESGVFKIDRKFHVGMTAYAQEIRASLLTIHPQARGEAIMDPIEVPAADLPYRVMTVQIDRNRKPLAAEVSRIRDEVSRSQLVYGVGLGCADIARSCGVPYILILEYDLETQITVYNTQVRGNLRRAVRAVRCTWQYHRKSVPAMREAYSLHCNGYPIHDATLQHNPRNLLYLDSRMSRDMVMSLVDLNARLAKRKEPLRLLYTGRYERMKGADDAVKVGLSCLDLGLNIEMHCYGQGSLAGEMKRLASRSKGRIIIHDAVPYPELVEISRTFDLFVCCHIQSDPSCTYLEAFGAGLPIVGYANRMWTRLSGESKVGFTSPINRPRDVADRVRTLVSDRNTLSAMSIQALRFAQEHCYESESKKRIDALNEAIA